MRAGLLLTARLLAAACAGGETLSTLYPVEEEDARAVLAAAAAQPQARAKAQANRQRAWNAALHPEGREFRQAQRPRRWRVRFADSHPWVAAARRRFSPVPRTGKGRLLVFLDLLSIRQVQWAARLLADNPSAIAILTQGDPARCPELLGASCRFDVRGRLASRLGVARLPATAQADAATLSVLCEEVALRAKP